MQELFLHSKDHKLASQFNLKKHQKQHYWFMSFHISVKFPKTFDFHVNKSRSSVKKSFELFKWTFFRFIALLAANELAFKFLIFNKSKSFRKKIFMHFSWCPKLFFTICGIFQKFLWYVWILFRSILTKTFTKIFEHILLIQKASKIWSFEFSKAFCLHEHWKELLEAFLFWKF